MTSPTLWQLLLIFAISSSLSGCALFEALGGMPQTSDELAITPFTTTPHIFVCVEGAVFKLKKSHGEWWATDITRRDEIEGVIETGRFSDTNIAGLRVRATHLRDESIVKLELNGTGPYYVDLRVTENTQILKEAVHHCLLATVDENHKGKPGIATFFRTLSASRVVGRSVGAPV